MVVSIILTLTVDASQEQFKVFGDVAETGFLHLAEFTVESVDDRGTD